MKTSSTILMLVLASLIIVSCRQQPEKQQVSDPSRFEGLITGFTSGIVPSNSQIRVMTAKPIQGFQPGAELPMDIIAFNPPLRGKAMVDDAYALVFMPDGPMRSGQQYQVNVNLRRLFDTADELSDFVFTFQVVKQDFTVFRGQIITPDPDRPEMQRYEGKLVTSDAMSLEEASKLLRASSPYREFEVNMAPDGLNTFVYSIEDIPRLDDAYSLEISWDGRPLNIQKRGSFKVDIASANEFTFLSFEVNNADQSIILTFSDPLDTRQQIEGLVRLEGADDVRIARSGAVVTLFPRQRISGARQVTLDQTILSAGGKRLEKTITLMVALEALPPKVELIGSGNIMPDSEGLSLPFRAVSLRAVDVTVYKIFADNIRQFYQFNRTDGSNNLNYVGRPVFMQTVRLDQNPDTDLTQWNGFSVDLTGMIKSDPMAIYRVRFSFKRTYAVYDCAGPMNDKIDEGDFEMSRDELAYWEGRNYWYNQWPENYRWSDRNNPCTDSYYISDRFPERNILYSNLGIIAKSADNRKFEMAVTNLLTAAPVGGAKLEFFNFQRQKVGEGVTAPNGMAEVTVDQATYLVSATHGGQRTWMRLFDGSSLSLSSFDVAGKEVQEGIKGFIYGERGVWRPGDTLFLTFLLDDVNKRLPADHPVLFELFDARGNLVEKRVRRQGVDNFYTFITPTKPDAPTGNWRAKVSVGGAVFQKQLKIEHVKPNRLKMELNFGRDALIANDRSQRLQLQSSWLHGAPAANLRASVTMRLLQRDHLFEGYESYNFNSPSKSFFSPEEVIFDQKLDQNGIASIPLHLHTNRAAPGMLSAVFTTRVFEQGGDFSTDVFTIPFAPFTHFVGIKIDGANGRHNRIETDREHVIEVASLDDSGHPVSIQNLEMKLYKLSWRWWWGADMDNLAGWISGQGSQVVQQKSFSTVNGKGQVSFTVDYPNWGHYFVEVSDPSGGHTAGTLLFFDWPSHISRAGRQAPAGATMLAFSADKEKYNVGEKAVITFPSSDGARALISIENASQVMMTRWIECSGSETSFDLNITGNMAPNIYVNITLIQPHHQTLNDLPVRLYGIIPLMVEDPQTILTPVIKASSSVRPESAYNIGIAEQNGKAMTYTIAIVDEGLLGLTRFGTPDPWQSFYAREALGVKTWDMFDEVLGAFGGQLQKILAIGGDAELLQLDDQKANRFKPVVTFAGPFILDAGQERQHKFAMPNYIGEVRVMVIAGREGAWGAAGKSITVKQPLMVLPTLPRVLSPGEEVSLPVSVFAMEQNVKNVSVSITPQGALLADGETEKTMTFSSIGEEMLFFKLKATDSEGVGKVKISAVSGGETAGAEIEIDVLHPNPFMPQVENYILAGNDQLEVNMKFHGIEGSNSGAITLSTFPTFDLEKNLDRLISYPFGCLEQIISAAFAQLHLEDILTLSSQQQVDINNNIRLTISLLPRYKLADGDFTYWPGSTYRSGWASVHAGHFMVLARQKGYTIPDNLINDWLDVQSSAANRFDISGAHIHPWEKFTQAYRLYVLAQAGKPSFSAMNRLREDNTLQSPAKWRLAAAYAIAGRPEAAQKLIENAGGSDTPTYHMAGPTFGSSLRDQAMILETLTLIGERQKAFDLLVRMDDEYNSRYMSTQTAAFIIYSISRLAKFDESGTGLNFSLTIDGQTENIISQQPAYSIPVNRIINNEKLFTVKNNGQSGLYLTTTAIGKSDYGKELTGTRNLEMTIEYVTIDGAPLDVTKMKQGVDFVAVIKVRNPGQMGNYKHMALSYTVPSGWEILNKRLHDLEGAQLETAFTYRDIRDDRVDTFFDLNANRTATYRIELNAAYSGRFYLPATLCEAMYEHNIYAIEKGRWIEVVR